MIEFFNNLFENDFMPHGHCYFWEPSILWSHAISDGIIALAYCAIPFSLITIFRKHHDTKFIWMMILFAVFIFGCGVTHVFDVINIWVPYYRADSVARVITAIASVATAVVLIRVTPDIMKIPSISEWKKLNEEMKEKLKQLEEKDQIIESIKNLEGFALAIPQIMMVVNKNGQINYMNEKWHEYSNAMKQNDLEYFIHEFIYPDQQILAKEHWQTAFEKQEKIEFNVQLKSKNGAYKWFLLRGQALNDEIGVRWITTLTDIDEQIIKNTELSNKNEELTRLNNDLDNFVYTASHDLRSPINNLEGLIEIYEDEPLQNEKARSEMWYLFAQSISRLKSTINDIADIAKLQRSKPEDIGMISFEEIYQEVLEDLHFLIASTNSNITVDFQQAVIKYSNRNLRSILFNLLSNAIKYCKPNQVPEIRVSTYEIDNKTILEVTDEGLGIKREHHGKIFEMFRRYNNKVEGTGLGLYIVKRILQNTGGVVEVESIVNNYTTFRIIF